MGIWGALRVDNFTNPWLDDGWYGVNGCMTQVSFNSFEIYSSICSWFHMVSRFHINILASSQWFGGFSRLLGTRLHQHICVIRSLPHLATTWQAFTKAFCSRVGFIVMRPGRMRSVSSLQMPGENCSTSLPCFVEVAPHSYIQEAHKSEYTVIFIREVITSWEKSPQRLPSCKST